MNMRERGNHERPADGSLCGRWSRTQNGVVELRATVRLTSGARPEKNISFARIAQCASQHINSRATGARRYSHAGRTSLPSPQDAFLQHEISHLQVVI